MPIKLTPADLASVAGLSSREAAEILGVGKSTINDARRRFVDVKMDEDIPEVLPSKLKVLAFDLENSPNLGYFWALWDQNIGINQLEATTEVICFGARWLDEEEVIIRSVYHDGKKNMLSDLRDLVHEADAVMGWNSKGFDSKHVNREFVENGILPPSPWKDLDLMLAVKRVFKFPSNKLDYVAQKLGVGAKVQHSGFQLWRDCMRNDPAAWAEMIMYQAQDVNLLIDLYEKLQPWLKTHPAWGLYNGKEYACANCGGVDLQRDGYSATQSSLFRRFVCTTCGTWLRDNKAVARTHMRIAS